MMFGSILYRVGAASASCVGTPRARRDKADNKVDAHIESGKQVDEIRRLERNLCTMRKRLGDSKKKHCCNSLAAKCTMRRLVFVGRNKHGRMENYRERNLIYPLCGDVTSRACDPGIIIPRWGCYTTHQILTSLQRKSEWTGGDMRDSGDHI